MKHRKLSGPWSQTFTGGRFYPYDPRPEDVSLEDIAQSLSNTCRYNGHLPCFYSVAQHSVIMSRYVKYESALWALFHDAPEAYLSDLPRPVKYGPVGEVYLDIETNVMRVIAEHFGLQWPMPKSEINYHDRRMLATEVRDLQPHWSGEDWESIEGIEPYQEVIKPMLPHEAKVDFLLRVYELANGCPRWNDGETEV